MEENKILAYVRGNDVLFIVSVNTPEIDGEGQPIEDSYVPVDFTGWDDYSLRVVKQGVTRTIVAESSQLVDGEDGKIVVDVPYTAPCGTYSLELVGRQNGRHERSYEIMIFAIAESNDKANLIYEVIDGYKSTDLDITVQLVQSALVYGENAYQMWKHLSGNEDKTLQDYIDEVLDLASMTQECADIIENAKPDLIYEDNYVYRWNPVTHAYAKTNIYVKGDQGEQGEQGIQGIQGVQGIQGERGLQGERGEKGDDGVGISGIEFEETDENGNNVYNIYTTDENSYQLVSPRGPSGQDGQDGTDGAPGLPGADGQDGITPHIDVTTGNWFVGSTDTGIHAQGQQGIQGPAGQDGQDGQNGTNGTNGVDGITPHIDSTNKHWMIGSTDTGIVAEGQDGADGTDGVTPHIDPTTKHWMIGKTDTGIVAEGTTPDLSNYVQKSSTAGLLKNDGTVDTTSYGTYSKPSTGIPSSDLSSAVQASLGKADTALQTETDPTVPSWAKASSKPSYTASEVGAVPTTRTVNGKALSSDVTLSAGDVGALPSSTPIPVVPTNVSAFQNDAGYLTSHQDISGKEDKMAIDSTAKTASFTASVGNYYFVNIAASGSITVTLTTPSDNSSLQNAVFRVTTSTSPQLIFAAASGIDVYEADGYKIEADKIYEVNAQWNGVNWDIASVTLKAQS